MPLSFVVASAVVPFEMLVTVTLAPATAFPCGSVTEPVMLPYTAWPEAVLVHSKNAKQQSTAHPRIASFLITPLLSTIPHPTSNATDRPNAEHPLRSPVWFNRSRDPAHFYMKSE